MQSAVKMIVRSLGVVSMAVDMVGMSGCARLYAARDERPGVQLARLKATDGMRVELFATGLRKARHMALGDAGTLYVGSFAGDVYAVKYAAGKVSSQRIELQGLRNPSGLALIERAWCATTMSPASPPRHPTLPWC